MSSRTTAIIVVILVLAALIFLFSKQGSKTTETNKEQNTQDNTDVTSGSTDDATETLDGVEQGILDIESTDDDVNGEDFNGIDKDLENI